MKRALLALAIVAAPTLATAETWPQQRERIFKQYAERCKDVPAEHLTYCYQTLENYRTQGKLKLRAGNDA